MPSYSVRFLDPLANVEGVVVRLAHHDIEVGQRMLKSFFQTLQTQSLAMGVQDAHNRHVSAGRSKGIMMAHFTREIQIHPFAHRQLHE